MLKPGFKPAIDLRKELFLHAISKSFLMPTPLKASKPRVGISVSTKGFGSNEGFFWKGGAPFVPEVKRSINHFEFISMNEKVWWGKSHYRQKKGKIMLVESSGRNVRKSKEKIHCGAVSWKTGRPVVNLKREWKENDSVRRFVRETVIQPEDYRKVPREEYSEWTIGK